MHLVAYIKLFKMKLSCEKSNLPPYALKYKLQASFFKEIKDCI